MFRPTKAMVRAEYAQLRDAIQATYVRHRDEFPDLAARQYFADVLCAMRCRDAQLASLKRKRQK